jgi:nucleoside-diphosphate-sugar epimerase
LDLRHPANCATALLAPQGERFDEVYQLAADMGGMGFIHTAECDIVHNNTLINTNMINAAAKQGVKRYFFSSSVCVYPDMNFEDGVVSEESIPPAAPDNEYGWEKYYAERVARTFARHFPIEVRIARFQNCYGPYGTYEGGREKAPAAICRKVAKAKDGGSIEVWGDGTAIRGFTYIDDLVRGIHMLMQSDTRRPANIGTDEYVTVNDMVEAIIHISGKELSIEHVDGPVGVQARRFLHARMKDIGWKVEVDLVQGLKKTYKWIAEQVW